MAKLTYLKLSALILLFIGCNRTITMEDINLYSNEKLHKTRGEQKKILPKLNKESKLQDYLKYAALNNAKLRSAFYKWKASLERIDQVTSLPDPKFNYAYFIENVETRVGPQEHKFGISQTFPWFGKLRLKGNIAARNAEKHRYIYDNLKFKVFYKVKKTYSEYYFLAKRIFIIKNNLSLLKSLEKVTRQKYTTSEFAHSGIIKIQIALAKIEEELKGLQNIREPIETKLNAAINRNLNANIPLPEKLPKVDLKKEDRSKLVTYLKNKNPKLKSLAADIKKEQASIKLAQKQYFPDFTLGVDYIDTGSRINANPPDESNDPVVFKVSVNIPIWFKKYKAGITEAKNNYKAAIAKLTSQKNKLVSDLKLAMYKLEDSQRKINLYKNTLIPKAKESLEVTLQSFISGKSDFDSLIKAQRVLLDFELSLEKAIVVKFQTIAKIEMIVGSKISVVDYDNQMK